MAKSTSSAPRPDGRTHTARLARLLKQFGCFGSTWRAIQSWWRTEDERLPAMTSRAGVPWMDLAMRMFGLRL